jgi:FAD/FMN-containing dehydrogenase
MEVQDRLEWVEGWGMAVGGAGYVFRPANPGGVAEALEAAHAEGIPIALRGAGCSYGDAAYRPESVVLDLSGLSRVLDWDPETGAVDVEPGVSLAALWRMGIADGWWPPVVTGTMEPTVGGMLAMNVHGKNNWRRGTFGEHCTEFDIVLANGESRTVSRANGEDIFHDVIGSFGQLGIITRARLQMKRVHSGLVEVKAVAAPDLEALLSLAEDAKDRWEYVVGWIDAFAACFTSRVTSRRARTPTLPPASMPERRTCPERSLA